MKNNYKEHIFFSQNLQQKPLFSLPDLLTIFIFFCSTQLQPCNAQFVNGIGIMGGATFAKQNFYSPPTAETLKKKFIVGFNGCAFAEFFNNDYLRWVTEFEYNNKGGRDKTNGDFKNKLTYLCWNNYLKIRSEFYIGIPYLLIGPKLEYLLSQNIQSPPVTSSFHKLHGSASFGAGWEFIVFSSLKPVAEIHYNPDIKIKAYKQNDLEIKNKAWELRIGLKYVFTNTSQGEKCPPVYK